MVFIVSRHSHEVASVGIDIGTYVVEVASRVENVAGTHILETVKSRPYIIIGSIDDLFVTFLHREGME